MPLNDYFLLKVEIEKLKNDFSRLKIFHGRKMEHVFNNIINAFHLWERKDFVYMEFLKDEEIVRAFWNYRFKPFSPLLDLKGEEV